MMLYSIDRFEGNIAVLIDERQAVHSTPRAELPADAKVGDMLRLEDERYILDDAAARVRREQILRLQNKLRRK